MLQALRTILLVGVVTILVWLWAEAESLSSEVVSPRIEIAGGPDLAARLSDDTGASAGPGGPGGTQVVRVRARGAKLAIDRLQQLLQRPVRFTPGVGGIPAQPGEHAIDLRSALREHPDFARLGVSIDEVEPATLRIALERLVVRALPIRLDVRGLALEGPAAIAPSSAELRLTESAAERLPGDAAVLAVIDPGLLAGLPPDASQTLPARLVTPPEAGTVAGLAPLSAQVTLKLRSGIATATLDRVPVLVILPPGEIGRWDVELLDPVVERVQVSGPRDMLGPLAEPAGRAALAAYVRLTPEDLAARVASREATFTLAPSPLRFMPERPVVRLRIAPR